MSSRLRDLKLIDKYIFHASINIRVALDLTAQTDVKLTLALNDIVRAISFEQRDVRRRIAALERGK